MADDKDSGAAKPAAKKASKAKPKKAAASKAKKSKPKKAAAKKPAKAKAKPKAKKAAAKKAAPKATGSSAKASTPKSAPKRSSSRPTAGFDRSIAQFRDSLEQSVTLSLDRIQEVVDDAVKRGRMTSGDAEKMAGELIKRGRKQTDALLSELEKLVRQARRKLP